MRPGPEAFLAGPAVGGGLRVAVLSCGSGATIRHIADAAGRGDLPIEVVAVGTDRPGCGSHEVAAQLAVPAFVVARPDFATRAEWDFELARVTSSFSPDLVLSFAFPWLYGRHFVSRFRHRILCVHPSLLPAFAGMVGPAEQLAYGVKVTGVTLFLADEGIDTGPVVAQVPVLVEDGDDADSLDRRIVAAMRALLVDTLRIMSTAGWSVRGRLVTLGQARADLTSPR